MRDCFYIWWVILEYFVGNRRQEGVCLVVTACTFEAQPSLCRAEIVSILLLLLLLLWLLLPLLFNINHCMLSNLLWVPVCIFSIFPLAPDSFFVVVVKNRFVHTGKSPAGSSLHIFNPCTRCPSAELLVFCSALLQQSQTLIQITTSRSGSRGLWGILTPS